MFDLSKLNTQYRVRYMNTGLKRVLLGIDKENPQSNAFWAKNGFSVIREVEQEEGAILLAEKGL